MAERRRLGEAFDEAVRQVDRAIGHGMLTRASQAAAPRLERFRDELVAEKGRALARGAPDADWIRRAVRGVAEWAPEADVALLAALGAIARAAPRGDEGPAGD
jgi:hypothetical protein